MLSNIRVTYSSVVFTAKATVAFRNTSTVAVLVALAFGCTVGANVAKVAEASIWHLTSAVLTALSAQWFADVSTFPNT